MTKSIHPIAVKKMISYYYLVSFCPPDYINELKEASQNLRARLAKLNGVKLEELSELVAPEVAKRILAFHLATREVNLEAIDAFVELLRIADSEPGGTEAFQSFMHQLASLPGRAKPSNRLHRNKGCAFCKEPCRYGFFTLISEPDFITLKAMLDSENQKLPQERDAVKALWGYTRQHIWRVLEMETGIIKPEDLGNLSYCLLLLGTAKSRFALPEKQLKSYQEMVQMNVQRLKGVPLSLV